MKSRIAFAIGAAGLLSAGSLFTGAANAAPQPGEAGPSGVDQRVADFLQKNPGAQRVGENEVKIRDGMNLRFASDPHQKQVCEDGNLCVYDGANFEGNQIKFYECGDFIQELPRGYTMNSYQNNQVGQVLSIFWSWNPDTGQWQELGRSTPPDENPDVGAPLNQTNGVEPC